MKILCAFLCVLSAFLLGVSCGQGGGGRSGLTGSQPIATAADAGLEQRVADLEKIVADMAAKGRGLKPEEEQILSHMSLSEEPSGSYLLCSDDGPNAPCLRQKIATATTIHFDGVNVQITNGTGNTSEVNGLGNLIVGYQEPRCCYSGNECWDSETNERGGSHNLIVGYQNNYRAHSSLVVGGGNSSWAPFSAVLGGLSNLATEGCSVVLGGSGNWCFSERAGILGGQGNRIFDSPDRAISGGVTVHVGEGECGGE
jgi:hypothetical protein